MAVDLNKPGMLKKIAAQVVSDINNYCVTTYDGGHRWHLGASQIGDECKRRLWYIFRWCYREQTDGRQQRLFNRGHREEARFVEWLRGSGFEVWTHETPNAYDTQGNVITEGKQFRISYCNGHFGGSLDGIAKFPASYDIIAPVLLEFKTNGTGAAFNKICDSGMQLAKPIHWAQTCVYGSAPEYNFQHVLYFNINKNDDSLHTELTKLDHSLGERMRLKAEQIIYSQAAPARLSDNPTYRDCSYCKAKGICHGSDNVEKNCRSCECATPVANAEWFCQHPDINAAIPRTFVPKGCDKYKAIA